MKTYRKNSSKKVKKKPQKQVSRKSLMSQINIRVWFLLFLVVIFLGALSVRVLVQSLSTNEKYSRTALSQLNYSSTTKVAMPGDIFDANMTPIASSYRVYILILDPKVILATEALYKGTLDKTAELTAEVFDLNADCIRQAIEENPESSYLRYGEKEDEENPGVIIPVYNGKTVIQEEQKAEFLERQSLINNPPKATKAEGEAGEEKKEETQPSKAKVKGIWFDEEARRYYPYGDLASKLIGFRTIDTSEGLWGVEKSYSDILKGVNGREVGYLNEESDLERIIMEAENGYAPVTTIDINLTKMITDELDEWFAETDDNGLLKNSAKSVSILAMDPNTGAIKAYVTDTDFDLNAPSDLSTLYSEEEVQFFAENAAAYDVAYEAAVKTAEQTGEELTFEWDSELFPRTEDILSKIWRNTLISDSFEPGSTGKMITYAAALEENLITADTQFQCDGVKVIAKQNVKCHNYAKGGCGLIDSLTSVAASCNMAFVEIGELLGAEKFCYYQELFNLGQKTGVDLPGEASCEGLLYPAERMNDIELATCAFGQCYNVTRLQLAAAFCATINGGYYYKPYIVSQILDNEGGIVENIEPVLVRQVISEETSKVVRDALRLTVSGSELGTGYGVQVSDEVLNDKIEFIAKTGTAQKLPRKDNKYLISVISAAPMNDPQLVLYVTIDEYGGALQADSSPAQYLSGDIWGTISDYIGIYAEEDPGPDTYRYEETTGAVSDSWPDGESPVEDMDGQISDTPVPPEDDGSGTYNGIIVDPLTIINPEDAMPVYSEE